MYHARILINEKIENIHLDLLKVVNVLSEIYDTNVIEQYNDIVTLFKNNRHADFDTHLDIFRKFISFCEQYKIKIVMD